MREATGEPSYTTIEPRTLNPETHFLSMRILTGIQPSGILHVGNYFGAMHPCIEAQDEGQTFLFIADYHALTQLPDPDQLRERVTGVAVDWLACGVDPQKTVFFRQSDVPEVTELMWILTSQISVGLLERCTSYKDKIAQGITPNFGLFSYPVLMAADILLYKSNVVPVGKDQKQHLEVARDIAVRFNNRFGEILVVPDARIREDVAVVPGLDGRKMSKSYDNTIDLFGKEKALRKKVMTIITDSTPMTDPMDPTNCNVIALYKLFADDAEVAALSARYADTDFGYGHAKQQVFEKFWETFRPMRERRAELLENLDHVNEILRDGAERACAVAATTMEEIRTAIGLR